MKLKTANPAENTEEAFSMTISLHCHAPALTGRRGTRRSRREPRPAP